MHGCCCAECVGTRIRAKSSFVAVSNCSPLGRPMRPTAGMLSRCMSAASRRGIAHGDVYAHNVMASEEGHATLCDYGALYTAAAAAVAGLPVAGCRPALRLGGSRYLRLMAAQPYMC